jgi:hypothetical protein
MCLEAARPARTIAVLIMVGVRRHLRVIRVRIGEVGIVAAVLIRVHGTVGRTRGVGIVVGVRIPGRGTVAGRIRGRGE